MRSSQVADMNLDLLLNPKTVPSYRCLVVRRKEDLSAATSGTKVVTRTNLRYGMCNTKMDVWQSPVKNPVLDNPSFIDIPDLLRLAFIEADGKDVALL